MTASQPARSPWMILRVLPRTDRRATEALRDKGLNVYMPLEGVWRGIGKMKKPIKRPLIPGYIFAELPDDQSMDDARGVGQVLEIMATDSGEPLRVPSKIIGCLAMFEGFFRAFDETWVPRLIRTQKRGGRRASTHPSRFKKGQFVLVTGGGPFSGFVGQVQRTDRGKRIDVALTLFGRETAVTLDENALMEQAKAA